MKQYRYSLSGVINGEEVTIRKFFRTRNEAIDYMLKLCGNRYFDAEIEEEEPQTKHDITYVMNHNSNFRIARI